MDIWVFILGVLVLLAGVELTKAHVRIRRLTTQLDQAETTILNLNAKLARIYMHGYSLGDDVTPEFPHRVDTPLPPPPANTDPNVGMPS